MKLQLDFDGHNSKVTLDQSTVFEGVVKKKFWKSIWVLKDLERKEIAQFNFKSKYFVYSYSVVINSSYNGEKKTFIAHYKNKQPHIHFTLAKDKYLVVYHKGTKISYFKNDEQIALISKKKITAGYKNSYSVTTNSDCDTNLLFLLLQLMSIIEYDYSDTDSTVTVDLGKFHKELRPFDESWTPI